MTITINNLSSKKSLQKINFIILFTEKFVSKPLHLRKIEMSTFGEIAEPGTRTAWEDWDEIENHESSTATEYKLQKNSKPSNITSLYIFEGKYLSDCVKAQTDYELELVDTIPEASVSIFKARNTDIYVCTVRDYSLVRCSEIVEALKDYLIASKNVLTIQTKPLSQYQSTAPPQDCVVRSVATTKPMEMELKTKFPKLEQPNIISGLSAGVVSLREHLDLNGVALVCYMEYPEEYEVDNLRSLLVNLNIFQSLKTVTNPMLDSNLYM